MFDKETRLIIYIALAIFGGGYLLHNVGDAVRGDPFGTSWQKAWDDEYERRNQ